MGDGPRNRIGAALGSALSLAGESYLNRDQVCLVTFRDTGAQVLVPPTNSITLLRQRLRRVAIGGATPLAAGLYKVLQVVRQSRAKSPGSQPLLVLISDGEATSSIKPGAEPLEEAMDAARQLHREQIPAILIDTSSHLKAGSCMPRLTDIFETACNRLHLLTAGKVLELIDRSASGEQE